MKVVLSRAAQADLRAIARWIAKDNPQRALSFPAELRGKCLSLGRNPRRFPIAENIAGHEIRKCVFRQYLIFYRVLPAQVEVLQIIHGAMDWKAMLFRSD